MKKKDALLTIECLIASCEQGISGEWDASVGNGESGFEAMIVELERLKEHVESN